MNMMGSMLAEIFGWRGPFCVILGVIILGI